MMYEYELLPTFNYFQAIDGKYKMLTTDNSEIEEPIAKAYLADISDMFQDIVDNGSTAKLLEKKQLVKMRVKYETCQFALEMIALYDNEELIKILALNGFVFDKDNKENSLNDINEQLQGLLSLYQNKLESYEKKQNDSGEKPNMFKLVTDIELSLKVQINVQTMPILQLAQYINTIKENGKRTKNTDRTSR